MGKADGRNGNRVTICEVCGIEFHAWRSSKGRFCSYACTNRAPRKHDGIADQAIAMYQSGKGGPSIAKALGLRGHRSVYAILRRRGIARRTASQSGRIVWANMGAAARAKQVEAAHIAGHVVTVESLVQAAVTRHARQVGIGKHERRFAPMLESRGIAFDQQTPCGTYNIDFTIAEPAIAVELVTSAGSTHTRTKLAKRTEYILNRWPLYVIRFRYGRRVIEPSVIDDLLAWGEQACRLPAGSRQYRMVWPNGEAGAFTESHLNHGALIGGANHPA